MSKKRKQLLKGSVNVFMFVMLGMIIGMYLMGFTSPIISYINTNILNQSQGSAGDSGVSDTEQVNAGNIIGMIFSKMLSTEGLAFLGASFAGVAIISLFGGGEIGASMLSFAIPCYILFAVANVVFFPVVGYNIASDAPELDIFLTLIFNGLLILTVITFITGRD